MTVVGAIDLAGLQVAINFRARCRCGSPELYPSESPENTGQTTVVTNVLQVRGVLKML
jgi:hypothetical protein